MRVSLRVNANGIGEVVSLGDEDTDDVIADDPSQFFPEPSPREIAEVIGEVSGIEDSSMSSSAVFTPPTRSLALSSPPYSVLPFSHSFPLPSCVLSPQLHRSPSLHVRFLPFLDRRAIPSPTRLLLRRFQRCSCRRSNWSATTRRRLYWRRACGRWSEHPRATCPCDRTF